MQFCRVSGVLLPAIAGMLLRQIHHQPISCHFCNYRGGGNRQGSRVTLDDCGGASLQSDGYKIAVNQQMTGTHAQTGHRALHRQMRGAQNVQPVDLINRGMGNANLGASDDLVKQRLSPCRSQSFGIVQSGRDVRRIEDHRRRRDWPGKRAAPNLIHPGHRCGGAGQFKGIVRVEF